MAMIVKHITLDVAAQNVFQSIVAKQYDSDSRFLKVRLTNEGEPINVEPTSDAVINASREDDGAKAFAGTVNDDGTITVPLTYWMLELAGQVECDISVFHEGRRLSSTSLTIFVEPATYGGDDVSADENCDILVELIAETKKIAESFDSSNVSNGITGSVTGNPVVLTDVSPFEHKIKVTLTCESHINPTTVTLKRYGATESDNPQTYTPNADGTVEVTSLYPITTLVCDTAGVSIAAEYNRDTNKVIADLFTLIRNLNRITYINLSADWVQEGERLYSQVVAIDGVTANSFIEICLTDEQLKTFSAKDVSFSAVNKGGVVTVKCVGQKPASDYRLQVKITEVSIND